MGRLQSFRVTVRMARVWRCRVKGRTIQPRRVTIGRVRVRSFRVEVRVWRFSVRARQVKVGNAEILYVWVRSLSFAI